MVDIEHFRLHLLRKIRWKRSVDLLLKVTDTAQLVTRTTRKCPRDFFGIKLNIVTYHTPELLFYTFFATSKQYGFI